jgi:phosphate transport system permease protein
MLLVLILFAIARIIGGRGPGNLTKFQQKRRAKRSREDSQRFTKMAAARVASSESDPAPSGGPRSLDFGDPR